MSVSAKQRFLSDAQKELGRFITVSDMEKVVDAMNRVLASYDMNETETNSDSDAQSYLSAFLAAKRLEGRSEKTVERYEYVLTRLFAAVKTPIHSITVFHLRNYLSAEKDRGISDSTIEGNRSVYTSFFGWLQKEGLLKENPCANLAPIKCARKVRVPYTDVDLERLKEQCGNDRDRALVSFLLSTGCRISEVCALDRDSLDFRNMECKVLGKGNKERVAFFDNVTAMLLRRYLDSRQDSDPALFLNIRNQRLTPSGVRQMLVTLSDAAGVENVHPHRFRRTLATSLISRGMPIQEVAAILGHDKLDTTMRYVHLDRRDVHNSYRKYA